MIQNAKNAPIAVFDSGAGGLGVLQELQRSLPCEDLLYFGDAKMAPYGERAHDEIKALVLSHGARLLTHAKALVVACNTATAVAIDDLRLRHPHGIIVGMEPAVCPALTVALHPTILILATAATLKEQKLQSLLDAHRERADFIKLEAPGLVRLVEAGLGDSSDADAYLKEILSPYLIHQPDAIVLGCTHFPFAKNAIGRVMGKDMPLFDGAAGTARQTRRLLEARGLLKNGGGHGTVTLTASDPRALALYRRLLVT